MLSPICLFTYNRLNETVQTVESLKKNYLANESNLIIYSDGGKDSTSWVKVTQVRDYLKTIKGFKSVTIRESLSNKGLANSIIEGVSEIANEFGKVIVLEDDLVTLPNFLNYMNQCLDFYENDKRIISVCGYGLKIKMPKDYNSDIYLYGRSSSWGWGTWKDRWENVDWDVKDWNEFTANKKAIRAFNYNGSDMYKMLKSVTEGNAQSWAIRFAYAQFKQKKYSIMPFKSMVANIGFGDSGTNTKFKFSRFKTEMENENKISFELSLDIGVHAIIEQECYKYHSLPIRIYSRIRYILGV